MAEILPFDKRHFKVFEDVIESILNKLIRDIKYHTTIITIQADSMLKATDIEGVSQLRECVHTSREHLDKLNELLKELEERWIY